MVQQGLLAHQAGGQEQLGLPGVVRKGPDTGACPSPTFPDRCRTARGTRAAPTAGTGHPRNGDRMRLSKDMGPQVGKAGQGCGELETDLSVALLWPWG